MALRAGDGPTGNFLVALLCCVKGREGCQQLSWCQEL